MIDIDNILPLVAKPARYAGGEYNSIIKEWNSADIKLALAYPDLYEIGMSNLGLSILYQIVNQEPYALAERVYAPWIDMEVEMREASIPLFSLESRHPLSEFDIIGFSLGYELTYTNVLNMLDLAGIPLQTADRKENNYPLIIAGGTCALNPEPVADFIDAFVLGDGEEVILELIQAVRSCKRGKLNSRYELLLKLADIPGVYVPSLYNAGYNDDNTISGITPVSSRIPATIQRRIVNELPPAVTKPVMPFIATVHDRAMIEIQRGCTRGCRFCQAGIVYRPRRERSSDEICKSTDELLKNTGYNEISLLSLSTTDYSKIHSLIIALSTKYKDENLKISLPSLRIDNFSVDLLDFITSGKKTSLTFAPEAGSERLRNVINKSLPDDVLLQTMISANEHGWGSIKLYFMLGLPTETIEDVEHIADFAQRAGMSTKNRRRPLNLKISVSPFVPKAHTPFQWVPQIGDAELNDRIDIIRRGIKKSGMRCTWHDPKVSYLEAILSRGDRRLSRVIYRAWQLGARFDAWSEQFSYDKWMKAFSDSDVEPSFYANRQRSLDEILPWDHIDVGVSKDYLKSEYYLSNKETATEDCRFGRCNYCGLELLQSRCQQLS